MAPAVRPGTTRIRFPRDSRHAVPMNFEVVEATQSERSVLSRLLELYCYDFSEFNGSDVDAHGAYGYPYVDVYWSELDRSPFLVGVDGRWAGLALVRGGEVCDLAEFFVMRKNRRTGVGRFAAGQLFARFPGPWAVRQQLSNPAATTFWRAAIPYPFTETSTETEVIQRFDSGPDGANEARGIR